MTEYPIHEVAEDYPLMTGKAFDELVLDIKTNGQLVPIELFQRRIIDGRNRLRACKACGREPEYVEVDDIVDRQYGGSVARYVESLNRHRRHLTRGELAIIGGKLKKRLAAEAKERQGHRSDLHPEKTFGGSTGDAREIAGEQVGFSGPVIDAAEVVVEKGTPKLIEAVKAGVISVSGGRQIADHRTPEEQDEIADRRMAAGKRERKREKRSFYAAVAKGAEGILCQLQVWRDDPDGPESFLRMFDRPEEFKGEREMTRDIVLALCQSFKLLERQINVAKSGQSKGGKRTARTAGENSGTRSRDDKSGNTRSRGRKRRV